MTDEQRAAVHGLKPLLEETHALAVPDEAAAIEAASAWSAGLPPAGRPYDLGADRSGEELIGAELDNDSVPLPALHFLLLHHLEAPALVQAHDREPRGKVAPTWLEVRRQRASRVA